MNKKETFYITTSIFYVNDAPHLGHTLEIVQADVIARRERLLGREVYFLTGVDEHGAKILKAAEKAKKPVEEFVNEGAAKYKSWAEKLNISNDDFIRTSDKARHFPAVEAIWKKLDNNNDIYKKSYKGLYCLGHEAFITEKDLENGKCKDHLSAPEPIQEENYFFRLSKYQNRLKELIEKDRIKIFPEKRKNEVLSFIKEGLEDLSVSRPAKDISWGVPVPGDDTQTIYVWFDALINYISALGFPSFEANKFWPANLHIIGKDILRFHAIIWPAMLLAAELPLPEKIFVHGFISVGGKKMSKTIGNVVNPLELVKEYGEDALRYYLIREIPTFEDGDYTEEKFKARYEGELAKGLGNLISRISTMAMRYFNGLITKPDQKLFLSAPLKNEILINISDKESIETISLNDFIIKKTLPSYNEAFSKYELGQALNSSVDLMKVLDRYIQEYQPFKLIKEDREKTKTVLWNLCYGVGELALLLKPFMPNTSEKILKIFGIDSKPKTEWNEFKIAPHDPLFPSKNKK